MYVGRIVGVGRTRAGANSALYRVSSRSFPNRRAVELNGHLAIIPREGHEADLQKSPYISYNCLRVAGEWAVVSNGSQTDPIAEKILMGVPVRDALASVLLALDYEKDDHHTPRIAGAVPFAGERAWLGIVRQDALAIKSIPLEAGRVSYLATYVIDDVDPARSSEFDARSAVAAARFVVDGGAFAAFEHPVTSAAALVESGRFALATWLV
ncbi:MAG: IMP cyclohydrolase [Myxococcota bacterium]